MSSTTSPPGMSPSGFSGTSTGLRDSVSVAIVGSGGAGVMTCGQMLLDAAAKAGWYGLMTRSFGPQIRGGEAAAFVTIACRPVQSTGDQLDLLVAVDWQNIGRFIDELPLLPSSLVVGDPANGEIPEPVRAKGPREQSLALGEIAKTVEGGRANMVALGALATVVGLPQSYLIEVAGRALRKKGETAMKAAEASFEAGAAAAATWGTALTLAPAPTTTGERWNISGNEGAGMGALRAGVRFCAAYPITPATDILEWLAPRLTKVGGALVQAEDELASINMCLGGSFGGAPSITSTSGPGLALMAEALGLAVGSETPVVVVDVMRGGPSTGIPTKCEQSDLDIALHGLHGDAPHLVLAPNSISDCLATTQWAVALAEGLQTAAIVLSDQTLGQARAIVDKAPDPGWRAQRRLPTEAEIPADGTRFKRYANTADGVSPLPAPGMPGCEFVAESLEHGENGLPSTRTADHQMQLDKRHRKLADYDFGSFWADVDGEGEVALLTWGSCTGAVLEAAERLRARGQRVKVVSLRLLMPAQPEKLAQALAGVSRVVVFEMSHSRQFTRYLRSYYDIPVAMQVFARPGPLPLRPGEVVDFITAPATARAA